MMVVSNLASSTLPLLSPSLQPQQTSSPPSIPSFNNKNYLPSQIQPSQCHLTSEMTASRLYTSPSLIHPRLKPLYHHSYLPLVPTASLTSSHKHPPSPPNVITLTSPLLHQDKPIIQLVLSLTAHTTMVVCPTLTTLLKVFKPPLHMVPSSIMISTPPISLTPTCKSWGGGAAALALVMPFSVVHISLNSIVNNAQSSTPSNHHHHQRRQVLHHQFHHKHHSQLKNKPPGYLPCALPLSMMTYASSSKTTPTSPLSKQQSWDS